MSEGADMLQIGQQDHEGFCGDPTFVYCGRHWPCLYSGQDNHSTLVPGGFEGDDEMQLTVRRSAMPLRTVDANEGWNAASEQPTADNNTMPPREGATVLFNQKLWRILKVYPRMAHWVVALGSPDK